MWQRTGAVLAWALWLLTFGCCAAGLLVTLAISRPLTLSVLVEGAVYAFLFVLGSATVGLALALRRPANPIGWLYMGAGLAWAYSVSLDPWIEQLIREGRPVPPIAQVAMVTSPVGWAPAITLGVILPALLLYDGHLRSRRWRVVVASSLTAPSSSWWLGHWSRDRSRSGVGSTTRSGWPVRSAISPSGSCSPACCCTG